MTPCPNCQAENRPTAKFCDQCGAALPAACPACGTVARPGARFCDNCGQRLGVAAPARAEAPVTAPAFDEPVAVPPPAPRFTAPVPELHRFIPPALLDKLRAAQATGGMVGERRVVTMLFCDVKGSTAAASQLDPEEWAEVMNGAFRHLIAPVYRYEGTLARMMGDAILAFFGAPIAHEDDPQRAVLAGLDIVRDIAPYREEVRRRWGVDFDVRVGINTGLVMVGPVGSDLHMEYTALGDAINLAARMEQTAQPGTVQIAATTYRLVAPLVEVEDLGGITVKGKDEPVAAYRVLGLKAAPGRLRGMGADAPLTGREAEMAALRGALDGVAAGQGQIVWLAGEAGLGKSRLVREMHRVWQQGYGGGRWCETASVSYESEQPYGLFQRLMRGACGATDHDPPAVLREKLNSLLPGLSASQQAHAAPVLAVLFGLPREAGEVHLEGEAFKRQLFGLVPALCRVWAEAGPVILVFDDLHWADAASLALLEHLFALTAETRLLLVCAARPEAASPAERLLAAAKSEHAARLTEVVVGPLSAAATSALLAQLLVAAQTPASLRERILARAEGNPFFLEEVVRSLLEGGLPDEDESEAYDIPENVQSLLIARIDRLPEETRRTLQLAAIIGRTFQHRVLSAILENGAALDARLAELERAGLIEPTAHRPEVEYRFRHALLHEAAYGAILRRHRREFHRRVGEAIETLLPHQVDQNAPTLSRHFEEAGETARALKYTIQAGDAAYRLYANTEAIAHYTRALDLARREAAGSGVMRHIYTRRGRALELASRFAEALENYEALETLGTARGDRALVLEGVAAQGKIRAMGTTAESDAAQAEALLGRALALAQELGDQAAEARVEWARLSLLNWTGQQEAALAAGERAVTLARDLGLSEQLAFGLTDLSYLYMALHQPAQARAATEEAVQLWRQAQNQPMLANTLAFLSMLDANSADYASAIAHSNEAFDISQSIGNWWGMSFARAAVGQAYWDQGDWGLALAMMHSALENADRAGFLVPQFGLRPQLALVFASLGATDRALAMLAEPEACGLQVPAGHQPLFAAAEIGVHLLSGDTARARELARAHAALLDGVQSPYVRGAGYFLLALLGTVRCRLALAESAPDRALSALAPMLDEARRLEDRRGELEMLYWQGRAQAAAGQAEAARDTLRRVRHLAEHLGARRLLWPSLVALAEAGEPHAGALRAEARAIVLAIADRAGSPELKASFLARDEVKEILDL